MRVWARIEDHQLIETLQTRGLRQGLRFTKSQIVRAGLRALDAMTPGEFGEAVEQSEPLKPRDHGSDVIQRSLKSENRYSNPFPPGRYRIWAYPEPLSGWGQSPAPVRRVPAHGAAAYRATGTARAPEAGLPSPRPASGSS